MTYPQKILTKQLNEVLQTINHAKQCGLSRKNSLEFQKLEEYKFEIEHSLRVLALNQQSIEVLLQNKIA